MVAFVTGKETVIFPVATFLRFPWERVIALGGSVSSMENLRRDVASKRLVAVPAVSRVNTTVPVHAAQPIVSPLPISPINAVSSPPISPINAVSSPSPTHRPGLGCTVADNTILARGHLEGLAKGLGGFGVLRVSKERLEEAAQAAEQLGKSDLSGKIQEIAKTLPDVKDRQTAESIAHKLDQIVNESWDLGRRCKGGSVDIDKLKALARRAAKGEITLSQAIENAKDGEDA